MIDIAAVRARLRAQEEEPNYRDRLPRPRSKANMRINRRASAARPIADNTQYTTEDMELADYILVVQLDVPEAHDAEFNRLYDGEHVPNLLSVPGVSGGQRYKLERAGEDMLRYLAMYQIESPDIPESEEWQRKASTEGWVKVREHITARRRGVFRKM